MEKWATCTSNKNMQNNQNVFWKDGKNYKLLPALACKNTNFEKVVK